MKVYSAFSPQAGQSVWFDFPFEPSNYSADEFNNWLVNLPPNITTTFVPPNLDQNFTFTTQQVWVQTADEAIVCIMSNASFEVHYGFVDTVSTVAEYNIVTFEPFWVPQYGGLISPDSNSSPNSNFWNPTNSYMAVFLAFSSLLNGNISTTLTNGQHFEEDYSTYQFDGNVTV